MERADMMELPHRNHPLLSDGNVEGVLCCPAKHTVAIVEKEESYE